MSDAPAFAQGYGGQAGQVGIGVQGSVVRFDELENFWFLRERVGILRDWGLG